MSKITVYTGDILQCVDYKQNDDLQLLTNPKDESFFSVFSVSSRIIKNYRIYHKSCFVFSFCNLSFFLVYTILGHWHHSCLVYQNTDTRNTLYIILSMTILENQKGDFEYGNRAVIYRNVYRCWKIANYVQSWIVVLSEVRLREHKSFVSSPIKNVWKVRLINRFNRNVRKTKKNKLFKSNMC